MKKIMKKLSAYVYISIFICGCTPGVDIITYLDDKGNRYFAFENEDISVPSYFSIKVLAINENNTKEQILYWSLRSRLEDLKIPSNQLKIYYGANIGKLEDEPMKTKPLIKGKEYYVHVVLDSKYGTLKFTH